MLGGAHQRPYYQQAYREKYTGLDHTKWTKLVSQIGEELMRKQIAYILTPEVIALRTAIIAEPAVIHIPANETLNQENERKTIQIRRENQYKYAVTKRDNDMRKLEDDFGSAIVTLKDQVSDIIKNELNALQNQANVAMQTNQQKYTLLFNRLKTQWGPHNQGHVDILNDILAKLKGDESGWRRAIQIFDETVTSLEMTAQRNAAGEEIVGVVQPIMPAPLVAAVPTNAQLLAHHNATRAAIQVAAAAVGPTLNYRPTDARLKEYLLKSCKGSSIERYRKISDEGVLPRNLAWTWQEIRADILALADKDALEAAGAGKRSFSPAREKGYKRDEDDEKERRAYYEKKGSHSRGDRRERSSSRSRGSYSASVEHRGLEQEEEDRDHEREIEHNAHSASQAYHERSRSNSEDRHLKSAMKSTVRFGESQMTCFNCGGDHPVTTCQSKTCGTCGANFLSVEERKHHFWDTHRRSLPGAGPTTKHGYLSKNRSRSPSPSPYKRQYKSNSGSLHETGERPPQRKSYSSKSGCHEATEAEMEDYYNYNRSSGGNNGH